MPAGVEFAVVAPNEATPMGAWNEEAWVIDEDPLRANVGGGRGLAMFSGLTRDGRAVGGNFSKVCSGRRVSCWGRRVEVGSVRTGRVAVG